MKDDRVTSLEGLTLALGQIRMAGERRPYSDDEIKAGLDPGRNRSLRVGCVLADRSMTVAVVFSVEHHGDRVLRHASVSCVSYPECRYRQPPDDVIKLTLDVLGFGDHAFSAKGQFGPHYFESNDQS